MANQNRIFDIEDEYSPSPSQPEAPRGSNSKVFIIILSTVLLAGLLAGGSYFVLKGMKKEHSGKSHLDLPENLEKLESQKKMPDSIPEDAELQIAVRQYRLGYTEAAKKLFSDIIEKEKPDSVKSLALTYLGIISDDEGRFNLAIDFFRRAIKFQPDNFHAHYNLAIAYRHRGMFREAMEELEIAGKLRPDQISASIAKGELQYEQQNYNAALETFQGIYKEDKSPHALYNMGIVYKKTGKMAEAKSAFLDALNLAGAGEVAWKSASQLGILHATQGDLDNAKYYFETAIKLAPANAKYHYNLALVLHQKNENDAAVFHLNRAVELGSNNPEIYAYIARLYTGLGQTENAAATLEKGLKDYPMHPELRKQYADSLLAAERYPEAESWLKKMYASSASTLERAEILYNLGQVYQELKDFENAVTVLEQSRTLNPGKEETLVALADAYSQTGANHKAIALYREATKINPDNITLLRAQGRMFVEQGLMAEAEDTFEKLVENPMRTEEDLHYAYQFLGDIHRKRNQCESAIPYYQKNETVREKDYAYQSYMAQAECYLTLNKPALSALEKIEQAVAIKPDALEPRILLARALLKEGSGVSGDRALEELTLAIEKGGTPELLSQAVSLRGILWYKQGMYNKALDDFNRALELNPGNPEAFQNRKAALARLEESY